jgi:uncharacterized protein YcgL (UPF0745 family)
MYIYLHEKDDFECMPEELSKNLGLITFSMQLELNEDKKLAKEDVREVIKNLHDRGFHLQMPSDLPIDQLLERITTEATKKAESE